MSIAAIASDGSGRGGESNYTGGRTQEELDDLARDPSRGNSRSYDIEQGIAEREAGLGVEQRGDVQSIRRDPTGVAEFIDATGQKWDVKAFRSTSPTTGQNVFNLNRALSNIRKEISRGNNIILDTRHLNPVHLAELLNEVERLGWLERVIVWP